MTDDGSNIVDFNEYRANGIDRDLIGPVTVTLIPPRYRVSDGHEGSLSISITVENGDYQGVIDAIRENGGMYSIKPDQNGDFWFLPWPPAVVRLSAHEGSVSG